MERNKDIKKIVDKILDMEEKQRFSIYYLTFLRKRTEQMEQK